MDRWRGRRSHRGCGVACECTGTRGSTRAAHGCEDRPSCVECAYRNIGAGELRQIRVRRVVRAPRTGTARVYPSHSRAWLPDARSRRRSRECQDHDGNARARTGIITAERGRRADEPRYRGTGCGDLRPESDRGVRAARPRRIAAERAGRRRHAGRRCRCGDACVDSGVRIERSARAARRSADQLGDYRHGGPVTRDARSGRAGHRSHRCPVGALWRAGARRCDRHPDAPRGA